MKNKITNILLKIVLFVTLFCAIALSLMFIYLGKTAAIDNMMGLAALYVILLAATIGITIYTIIQIIKIFKE